MPVVTNGYTPSSSGTFINTTYSSNMLYVAGSATTGDYISEVINIANSSGINKVNFAWNERDYRDSVDYDILFTSVALYVQYSYDGGSTWGDYILCPSTLSNETFVMVRPVYGYVLYSYDGSATSIPDGTKSHANLRMRFKFSFSSTNTYSTEMSNISYTVFPAGAIDILISGFNRMSANDTEINPTRLRLGNTIQPTKATNSLSLSNPVINPLIIKHCVLGESDNLVQNGDFSLNGTGWQASDGCVDFSQYRIDIDTDMQVYWALANQTVVAKPNTYYNLKFGKLTMYGGANLEQYDSNWNLLNAAQRIGISEYGAVTYNFKTLPNTAYVIIYLSNLDTINSGILSFDDVKLIEIQPLSNIQAIPPSVSTVIRVDANITSVKALSSSSMYAPIVSAIRNVSISGATGRDNASLYNPSIFTSTTATIPSVRFTSSVSMPLPYPVNIVTALKFTASASVALPNITTTRNVSIGAIKAALNAAAFIPNISTIRNVSIGASKAILNASAYSPGITTIRNTVINATVIQDNIAANTPMIYPETIIEALNFSASFNIALANITTTKTVSIGAIKATLNEAAYSPNITTSGNLTVSVNKALLSSAAYNPSITTIRNTAINAAVMNDNITGYVPVIYPETTVAALKFSAIFTMPLTTISAIKNVVISSNKALLNAAAINPDIYTSGSLVVSVPKAILNAAALNPNISTIRNISVSPSKAILNSGFYSPAVSAIKTASIASPVSVLSAKGINPSLNIVTSINAPKAILSTHSNSPAISTALSIGASKALLSSAAKIPNIVAQRNLTLIASKAAASGKLYDPLVTVEANTLIKASKAALNASMFSISLDIEIYLQVSTFINEKAVSAFMSRNNVFFSALENYTNANLSSNRIGVMILALQGDTVKIHMEFRDYTGKLFDPDSINIKIYQNINDLLTTIPVPLENRINLGIYEYEYTVPIGSGSLVMEIEGMKNSKPSIYREKLPREWVV